MQFVIVEHPRGAVRIVDPRFYERRLQAQGWEQVGEAETFAEAQRICLESKRNNRRK